MLPLNPSKDYKHLVMTDFFFFNSPNLLITSEDLSGCRNNYTLLLSCIFSAQCLMLFPQVCITVYDNKCTFCVRFICVRSDPWFLPMLY